MYKEIRWNKLKVVVAKESRKGRLPMSHAAAVKLKDVVLFAGLVEVSEQEEKVAEGCPEAQNEVNVGLITKQASWQRSKE